MTKRVNYFDGQFLRAADLSAEQSYHIGMRQRHNTFLHSWGVADGLKLAADRGATQVRVSAGFGIDRAGREIVLENAATTGDLSAHAGETLFVTVAWAEVDADPTTEAGFAGVTRRELRPTVGVSGDRDAEGRALTLGTVTLDKAGRVEFCDPNSEHRTVAGVKGGDLNAVSLTLTGLDIASERWPRLSVVEAGRVDLRGALRVAASPDAAGNPGVGRAPPTLEISGGGLGFSGGGSSAKERKLHSPVAGVLEWGTDDGGADHGFAVSLGTEKRAYINARGDSYLNGGNVGIGIAKPSHQLHVKDDGKDRYALRLQSSTGNKPNAWSGIGFSGENDSSKAALLFQSLSNDWSRGKLILALNNDADSTSAEPQHAVMTLHPDKRVNFDGRVGIGIDSPDHSLDVAGRIRVRQAAESAGLWLYQDKKDSAFIGMDDDHRVGICGEKGGWGLRLNLEPIAGGDGLKSSGYRLRVDDPYYNRYTLRLQSGASNKEGAWGGIGFSGEDSNTKAAILFQSTEKSYSRGSIIFALNNKPDQTGAQPKDAVVTLHPDKRIELSGNVGIGTATPSQKLEISGGGLGFSGEGSSVRGRKLHSPAAGVLEWGTDDSGADHAFAVSLGNEKRAYLNARGDSYLNGGRVGIGTTSPGAQLEIAGKAAEGLLRLNGGNGNKGKDFAQIAFGYDGTAAWPSFIATRHQNGERQNNAILFYTSNGNANGTLENAVLGLSINGGKVGVGIDNPTHKLHVDFDGENDYALRLQSAAGNKPNNWSGIGFSGENSSSKAALLFQSIGDDWSRGKLILALNNEKNANSAVPGNAVMTLNPDKDVEFAGKIKSPMWRKTHAIDNQVATDGTARGNFETGGGSLLVIYSGTAFRESSGTLEMSLVIDGDVKKTTHSYTDESRSHKAFPTMFHTQTLSAGGHSLMLKVVGETKADGNDRFNAVIFEFPF